MGAPMKRKFPGENGVLPENGINCSDIFPKRTAELDLSNNKSEILCSSTEILRRRKKAAAPSSIARESRTRRTRSAKKKQPPFFFWLVVFDAVTSQGDKLVVNADFPESRNERHVLLTGTRNN